MSKYRAIRTNGYASKKEAKRAQELEILEKLGVISNLVKQEKFVLIDKDDLGPAIRYVADFCYWDNEKSRNVVEDVKGFRTPIYKLKRRLMFREFGIQIHEV